MSEVYKIRDLLFEELELSVRTTTNLIKKIDDKEWGYCPKENMRTLMELVHHLVQIPLADLTCLLQEKSEEDYRIIEQEIQNVTDSGQLVSIMVDNLGKLKDYVFTLSEDELMNKVTKPFYYEQGGSVQIKWLMEIVTHTFHHRSQLFTYLKQLGHEVNMFDLY